jgi:hypothetical protein
MLSTAGDLLCYCDARKLQWYLDKGLAEMVSHDPPTIRLLFEHKNADQQVCRGWIDNGFSVEHTGLVDTLTHAS